jgi:type II secretion system protein C
MFRRFIASSIYLLTVASGSTADIVKSDGSDLGISIMGSIIQKDANENVALIKEETGTVKAVKVGHVIMDKYKVISVSAQYIEVITRDANQYLVYQDKFAGNIGSKKSSGPNLVNNDVFREEGFERNKDKIVMTGMYRDKLVQQDLAKVLMQATAEPHMENGSIAGFKMSQIDDGSIYQKAGLKDGDVVTGINGSELNSVAGSITLLKSLKGADSMEVEIKRDGVPMKFTISVN